MALMVKNKSEVHPVDHAHNKGLEEQSKSPALTFVVIFSNVMPMCCSFSSGCVVSVHLIDVLVNFYDTYVYNLYTTACFSFWALKYMTTLRKLKA